MLSGFFSRISLSVRFFGRHFGLLCLVPPTMSFRWCWFLWSSMSGLRVCVSFSVFFVPSVLTDSGSGSDCLCVASSRHCEHCRFRSRAFSAHPAGLRSTHCVFLRSLLVGVSFRSCWHRFHSIRSFCVGFCSTHCVFLRSLLVGVFLVVSPNTLSCTHTRCC